MRRGFLFALMLALASATTARAHPGPRVWIGSSGATLATFASNNDLSPISFTPNRVFVGGIDEKTLLSNGRLDEFPVSGTGRFASEFPGYQVRTDGNSGLSLGSSFAFDLGPLLVFDGATFKPAWNVYPTQPRMNEAISTASLTTGAGVQSGFSFFTYNASGDHAHLTTTLLGNGTQAIDGPHAVYAVPLQLTGGGKAASLPYYVLFGRNLGVDDAIFQTARTTLQSIIASNAGTWIVDVNADWTKSGNWLANEPTAAGAIAIFGSAITAPRAVTLNTTRTLGQIRFDNANRYTIAGTGTLALVGGGTIDVTSGSHIIDVPISTVGPITKAGTGALTVQNVRAASLNVTAGTISVHANGTDTGTSKVQSLSIATGASLDLIDNDLIITNGTYNAVISLIRTARNNGLWNQPGLTSSAAAAANPKNKMLGAITGAEFHTASPGALFDGFSVANTDLLVKYTYYGDTDFNGVVDFDDYSRIDSGFNNNRTGWFNGDVDLNGIVDFDDYSLMDQAFNTQSGTLRAVPEPTSMLTVLALTPTIFWRSRRR